MCVLLSLEPRYFHELALGNKNKGREILRWRLHQSVTGFRVRASHCTDVTERIGVMTRSLLGSSPSGSAGILVPFGPLVCLWNTQEGTRVTACPDARRTGKALGNVSLVCERATLLLGGLPAWLGTGRRGMVSDNSPSVHSVSSFVQKMYQMLTHTGLLISSHKPLEPCVNRSVCPFSVTLGGNRIRLERGR